MKSNIWTIAKKEFARFFGDKKMVVSTMLLPGVMIYVMYTFMGSGLADQFTADETKVSPVAVYNMPDSLAPVFEQLNISIEEIDSQDEAKARVEEKTLDLAAVFPEDFDEAVENGLTGLQNGRGVADAVPNVELYYNSASNESMSLENQLVEILAQYESALTNLFDVNGGETVYDLASTEDTTAQIFSMMVPMLMMIFIFSGCMSIAPESIAGEKERGTIATLLVTPMKRRELALGKIISLSALALLCGLSTFIGTMLSLPKLMGAAEEQISTSVYGAADYALLLVVILSTVLLIIALISIISAFAKSVKEASTYVLPLMLVVMFIAISSMMGSGSREALGWYAIPLYNSVQCMTGIMAFTYEPMQIILTAAANLVCTGIAVVVLTRMFNSEKIMFSR